MQMSTATCNYHQQVVCLQVTAAARAAQCSSFAAPAGVDAGRTAAAVPVPLRACKVLLTPSCRCCKSVIALAAWQATILASFEMAETAVYVCTGRASTGGIAGGGSRQGLLQPHEGAPVLSLGWRLLCRAKAPCRRAGACSAELRLYVDGLEAALQSKDSVSTGWSLLCSTMAACCVRTQAALSAS
jgi:hypothetical protein